MQQRKVILHIGLHKTGTRYLQRDVFRLLDAERFVFNPRALTLAVRAAVRNPGDRSYAEAARDAVDAWRRSADSRTLIISEPHISGDMYNQHEDCGCNARLMRELFPEAQIIYFVRRQSDWLQSAYRQQLVKGGSIPMEVFLNHYNERFMSRPDRWTHGGRSVEALSQRFLEIYHAFATQYGAEYVHLFRQEDLRRQSADVKTALAAVLGVATLPEPPRERLQNRSYSALAIHLFHPRTLRRFAAPTAADCGRPARPFHKALRPLTRLRRVFIQHVFDRLIYRDRDLLQAHDMRGRIDAHYVVENAELARIAERVLQALTSVAASQFTEHVVVTPTDENAHAETADHRRRRTVSGRR